MISVKRYGPEDASDWNAFVDTSVNGTFLFDRGFMEYHADRFTDHSLLFHDDGALCGLLPANQAEDRLVSHGGLTYGGLVHGNRLGGAQALEIFEAMTAYARDAGLTEILYKCVPTVYHDPPSEQDRYALFRMGAERIRSDLSTAVFLGKTPHISKSRRQGRNRALKAGLEISQSHDWAAFWDLLAEVLTARHGVEPVHSLPEIESLAQRFPDKVTLHVARDDAGTLFAGTVLFETGATVHTQYLASSDDGRENGALDAVILALMEGYCADRRWLDFGISTEDGGRQLNTGLLRQKEMFGGTSVVYDHYRLQTGL